MLCGCGKCFPCGVEHSHAQFVYGCVCIIINSFPRVDFFSLFIHFHLVFVFVIGHIESSNNFLFGSMLSLMNLNCVMINSLFGIFYQFISLCYSHLSRALKNWICSVIFNRFFFSCISCSCWIYMFLCVHLLFCARIVLGVFLNSLADEADAHQPTTTNENSRTPRPARPNKRRKITMKKRW